FEVLKLPVREIVDIEVVVDVPKLVGNQRRAKRGITESLGFAFLGYAVEQPCLAAADRLIDGFGGGCESSLQGGESETDNGAAPSFSPGLEALGSIHLLLDVLGDALV